MFRNIALLLAYVVPLHAFASDGHAHAHDEHEEGHAAIPAETAEASGIRIETAGPAAISEKLALVGRIALEPARSAFVRARYPGPVRAMHKQLGDKVKAGEVLAEVESNESLRAYEVTSPLSGIVLARGANSGDMAGGEALYHIADLSRLQLELHAFPRQLARLRPGQPVTITSLDGGQQAHTVIAALPPVLEQGGQSVLARAALANEDGNWRPGMAVRGEVAVSEHNVALAVRTSALQQLRGKTVVFVAAEEGFEAREVTAGASDGIYTEIQKGLEGGARYVAENSFLIKADIEKSGAAHDH